jgi:hypothetical protein
MSRADSGRHPGPSRECGALHSRRPAGLDRFDVEPGSRKQASPAASTATCRAPTGGPVHPPTGDQHSRAISVCSPRLCDGRQALSTADAGDWSRCADARPSVSSTSPGTAARRWGLREALRRSLGRKGGGSTHGCGGSPKIAQLPGHSGAPAEGKCVATNEEIRLLAHFSTYSHLRMDPRSPYSDLLLKRAGHGQKERSREDSYARKAGAEPRSGSSRRGSKWVYASLSRRRVKSPSSGGCPWFRVRPWTDTEGGSSGDAIELQGGHAVIARARGPGFSAGRSLYCPPRSVRRPRGCRASRHHGASGCIGRERCHEAEAGLRETPIRSAGLHGRLGGFPAASPSLVPARPARTVCRSGGAVPSASALRDGAKWLMGAADPETPFT